MKADIFSQIAEVVMGGGVVMSQFLSIGPYHTATNPSTQYATIGLKGSVVLHPSAVSAAEFFTQTVGYARALDALQGYKDRHCL